MRAALAIGLSLWTATAMAGRPATAVLWIGNAADEGGEVMGRLEKAAAAIERALGESQEARPIDDASRQRLLIVGGPLAEVQRLVGEARRLFARQAIVEADKLLARAEETALRRLPVTLVGGLLGEIEALRLMCAELTRDEVAAARAAEMLEATGATVTPEVKMALERRSPAFGPPSPSPAVRVESEPIGAVVYVDLKPVGVTPVDLPAIRRADALVDIELAGFRKLHRDRPTAGTLAVQLTHDDGVATTVDRLRGMKDLPEADVAALGRQVGAQRVLVVRLAGGDRPAIEARVLEVEAGKWAKAPVVEPITAVETEERVAARLAAYSGREKAKAADGKGAAPTVAATAAGAAPAPTGWRKWYTWVIGLGLAAVVVGLVVAQNYGDDTLTVKAAH